MCGVKQCLQTANFPASQTPRKFGGDAAWPQKIPDSHYLLRIGLRKGMALRASFFVAAKAPTPYLADQSNYSMVGQ